MSKPRKVHKLAERRRQRAEAFGGTTYPIEGLDGEIVEIPYMSFWSEALSKEVFDDYPGDMEVLRKAITETWPDEPERLEAFERLGLQTGDTVEIITEVMRVKPGGENTDDDTEGDGDEGDGDGAGAAGDAAPNAKTAKASGAGKSPSSSGRSRSTARS